MKKQTTLFVVFFLLCSQVTLAHAQEIIITDADTIWNNTTQSSSDLNNVTSNVTARFLVEYVNSLLHLNFFLSPVLNILTQNVSARIIAEYANSLYRDVLTSSSSLENLTSEVVPRIIAEYANSLYSHNLVGSSNLDTLAEQVTARIITEYANSLKIFDLYEPDFTQPENRMPTANAGGPYYGNVNEQIQFDGGGTDPDGDEITAYAWDFDNDGIIDSTLEDPTWMWPIPGAYHPALKVKDDELWSKWDWCLLTVYDTNPYLGPYPLSFSDKYYLRIYNIDDIGKAYVNEMLVSSVVFGQENVVDITNVLHLGDNWINLTVINLWEGWTYGFEIIHDDGTLGACKTIWKDECGTAGVCGCNDNEQTGYKIVYDQRILLELEEREISDFTFVHMTDVHMGWNAKVPVMSDTGSVMYYLELSAQQILSAAVDEINEDIKPDFILDTGDIAEKGSDAYNYVLYREALKTLDKSIKVNTVPGNHDWYTWRFSKGNLDNYNDSLNDDEFINQRRYQGWKHLISEDDFNNYYFEHDGFLFIGLDSGYEQPLGMGGSGLTFNQMWEIIRLNRLHPNKPKIIFMHHPVFDIENRKVLFNGNWLTVDHRIQNYRQQFIGYCKNKNAALVLTGHTHDDQVFNADNDRWNDNWNKPSWPLFIQTPSLSKEEEIHGYREITIKGDKIEQELHRLGTYESLIIKADCPVTLHAFDSQGRHTGINLTSGKTERNIPRSFYFSNYTFETINEANETVNKTMPATIILYNVSQNYSFKIIANLTEEQRLSREIEHFNLTVEQQTNETLTAISYYNVSITENTTATLPINLTTTNYTMYIDYDGDNVTDETRFPDLNVTNYVPTATIILPENNSAYNLGEEIIFSGNGTDPEDGILTNTSLVWISDINGIINYGDSFSISNLSAGRHTITLMINDSLGLMDDESVELLINAPDLTLNSSDVIISNLNPVEGDIITINATIRNKGLMNATNVSVQFFDGLIEFPISNMTITSIEAEDAETVTFSWETAGKMGNHSIFVIIDLDNMIEEMNETNNHASQFILIDEYKAPIAYFTFTPEKPVVDQSITFNASSSRDPDGSITLYEWDFGDGNMSYGEFANHSYGSPGSCNVTLWVVDDDGEDDIYWEVVTIKEAVPPVIRDENPENGSINVERPPDELNVTVDNPDADSMDVYVKWKRHDYYHVGEWVTLQTYTGVGNGTYSYMPPYENDWIWGDTTYTWSVNVTDGTYWTNATYQYTTGGSRYDVNNNDLVNFQDAGLVWVHRTSEVSYDGIYDVNQDGQVNFQDAGLTWINRD